MANEDWWKAQGTPVAQGEDWWSSAGTPDAPTQATPAPAPIERPSSFLRRAVGDTAVDIGKGVIGVGEAAVGLGNLVSGGYVGKGLEAIGYDPQATKKMLEEGYTHERVAANKAVSDAKGFVGTAKALIENPSALIGTAVESAPLMLGGGAIARGGASLLGRAGSIAAPGIRGAAAAIPHTTAGRIGLAAAGEGAVGAGVAAEQIRQQTDDGLLSAKQTGAALASGAGTAALGALGGKVAQKLGIADVDVALAGGNTLGQAKKNILRRVAEGALSEGVFEELPQSAQEQMWQNYATGKPLMDGVAEASAMGALAGAAMGGPVAAIARPGAAPAPQPERTENGTTPPPAAPNSGTDMPNTGTPDPFDGNAINAELDASQAVAQPATTVAQPATSTLVDGSPIPDANAGPLSKAVNTGVDSGAVPTVPYPTAQPGTLADVANKVSPFGYTAPTEFGFQQPSFPPAPTDGRTRLAKQAQAQGIDPRIVLSLDDSEAGSLDEFDDTFLAGYAKTLWRDVQSGRRAVPGLDPQELLRGQGQDSAGPVPEQSGLDTLGLRGDAVPVPSGGQDEAGSVPSQADGGAASAGGQAAVPGEAAGAQAQEVAGNAAFGARGEAGSRNSRSLTGQQVLAEIASISDTMYQNHPSAIGAIDGTFAGLGSLQIDEQGNVVLNRVAEDEQHLGKGWTDSVTAQELRDTSEHSGSGRGLPTTGLQSFSDNYGRNLHSRTVGTFRIPVDALIEAIRNGRAYLGNLGEGEIVLSPDFARDYLSEINGKRVKMDNSGGRPVAVPSIAPEAAAADDAAGAQAQGLTRDNPLPNDREGDAPVGSWVAGPQIPGTTPADTVRQIVEVPIDQIDATEFASDGKLVPDKQADADRYAEAMRNGDQFPNARGSVLPNGKIKLQDGHRRLAAAIATGQKTLRIAVNPMPEQAPAVASETPTMQNRDRSRAASVAQMQDIRRNPDPERLGFSRDPNTGAPMVGAGKAIPDADKGRTDTVIMASGRRVPVQYAVVEADELAASHDADGRVNPAYDAAPLKALNNGRTAGLQAAYASGNTDAYRKGIAADAALHGVPAEAIAGKRKPVLVRLYDPAANTGDMGAESNATQQLGLSPVEQAQTDARALPDLSGLVWNEDGSISPNGNANFFRGWFANMGDTQAASLQDAQGRPNAAAIQRVRGAMVHRAYGDERLLTAMAEEIDPDNRNVMNALVRAAPGFAKLDDTPHSRDVKAAIVGGLTLLRDAKARGISLTDALAQQDIFGRNADADAVAAFMAANARSANRMADAFKAVAEYAARAEAQAATLDVFGSAPEPTVGDALADAGITEKRYGTETGRDGGAVAEGRGGGQQAQVAGAAAGDAFQLDAQPAAQAAQEVAPPSAGLFGAPTARDYIDAAKRNKDAARDGKTGTGRTDMLAGDGELFAGQRPEQAGLETGTLPAQDAAEYGETRPLQLGDQRGGNAARQAVASGRGPAPAIRNQLDLFVATRNDKPPGQGHEPAVKIDRPKLSRSVGLAQIGQFRSGHAVVDSLEKAAHILAPLRKSAQEQFLALVLDDAGKPLGVIRHTVGTIDSSLVEPGVVFSAIASIPGARRVVFAHNHPSGNIDPSAADRAVDRRINALLRGSGIESVGAIIVAPGRREFTAYGDESTAITPTQKIAAAGKTVTQVPSLERRLTRIGKRLAGAMSSPAEAARMAEREAAGKYPSGVILLDTRHHVIGIFGMSRKDMSPLRTGDAKSGIAELARRVHGANAAAAFVYGQEEVYSELKNLARAINALGVRTLDTFIIGKDGKATSLAAKGQQPNMGDIAFESVEGLTVEEDAQPTDAEAAAFDRQSIDRKGLSAKLSQEQGEADADALGLRQPVTRALGKSKLRVRYLRGNAGLEGLVKPGYIALLDAQAAERGAEMRTAGLFIPAVWSADDKPFAVVFTHVAKTPTDAAFTAAHEDGHFGLRKKFGPKLDPALKTALQNPTVKAVADSMYRSRKMAEAVAKARKEGRNIEPQKRMLAAEEALADLAGALATGDWQKIKRKHGVEVPLAMRNGVAATIARFIEAVRNLFRTRDVRFSNAQVRALLVASRQASSAQATASLVGPNGALEQVVFHGTPHTVDRFSLQKIGTGEGAQAYGWGLYFASQQAIAEQYRKNLSTVTRGGLFYRGARLTPTTMANLARSGTKSEQIVFSAKWPSKNIEQEMERRAAQYESDEKAKRAQGSQTAIEWAEEYARRASAIREVLGDIERREDRQNGNLYRVEVPEDSDLLDYDKPMSQNPPAVRERAKAVWDAMPGWWQDEVLDRTGADFDDLTGSEFYQVIGKFANEGGMPGKYAHPDAFDRSVDGKEAASHALFVAGIPGLRYLDGNSRGKGEGSANYVIWDEAAIGTPESALESAEGGSLAGMDLSQTKVVGKDGKPLTVFHGSTSAIAGDYRIPAFFSESREGAEWFAQDGGKVNTAKLDIRNPLDVSTQSGAFKFVQLARKAGVEVQSDIADDGKPWDFYAPEIAKHSPYDGTNVADLVYIPKVRKALGAAGYDGLKAADPLENGDHDVWVALRSEQIQPESTEDQTQSEAFRKWFGSSVVTETGKAGGKPLVVYHASTFGDFDTFDKSKQAKGMAGFGFYFTDREGSNIYTDYGQNFQADRDWQGNPKRVNVTPVFLRMENPLVVDDIAKVSAKYGKRDPGAFGQGRTYAGLSIDAQTAIQRDGYDGVIATEHVKRAKDGSYKVVEPGTNGAIAHPVYVVFEPTQVKSSLANNGNFDPSNPSILESVEGFELSDNPTAADVRIPGEINLSALHKGGFKAAMERIGQKFTSLKPKVLALIPLQELDDFSPKRVDKDGNAESLTQAVGQYIKLQNDMQAFRNGLYVEYDKVAQDLQAFASEGTGFRGWMGNRVSQQGRDLFALMHDSTVAGIDPSEAGTRFKEPEKAAKYRELQERYNALPEKGRELFKATRDAYAKQTDLLDEVLEGNVKRTAEITINRARRRLDAREKEIDEDGSMSAAEKKKARDAARAAYDDTVKEGNVQSKMAALRAMLEKNRVPRPYFPLKRYGEFWVSVLKDGKLAGFSKFQNAEEQQAYSKEMIARGFETRLKYERDGSAKTSAMIDPTFVAEVEGILAGLPNEIRDEVWQAYLERMPDMSLRKSFIHRKNVPGYHFDALKAFGSSMFHSSYQLSRLKYGVEMQEALDVLGEQANDLRGKDDAATLSADMIRGELKERHAFIMNPTNARWAQTVTGAAFMYSLGANPAHLFLNATQTIMLGLPVMGSRYGFKRATAAIGKAAKDFAKGKGHVDKASLTDDERRAFKEMQASGIIEKSQAHDMAGIGAEGVEYSAVRKKVMDKIGWFMHQSERFNREVTAIAGYRLARADGKNHEAAVAAAEKMVYTIHFDYSNSGRARIMQGDLAKALLVFRNYQANMLYRLFRDIHQSIRGESVQVKREARRQLGAIFGMYGFFAGAMGVPFYGLAMALAGLGDDDDDPVTAEQQFVNGTVEFLGPTAASILLRGLPGTVFDIDLTERVGMGNLWFRSPNQEMEGRDAYYYWMEQVLGAGLAPLKGFFDGVNLARQGQFQRGLERMAPAALRNPLQAIRQAQEGGVTSLDGDLIKETTGGDYIAKALGFQPLSVSEQYDKNSNLKSADRRLSNRREKLLNRYFLAIQMGDDTAEVLADVQAFNLKNPEYAITRDTFRRSASLRNRNKLLSENGIVMTRRMRRLRERTEGDTE